MFSMIVIWPSASFVLRVFACFACLVGYASRSSLEMFEKAALAMFEVMTDTTRINPLTGGYSWRS